MTKSFLALALALSVMPIAAVADDSTATPQISPEQRQAMRQTFERYAAQEEQLHQQMRLQVLNSMTAVHRRAVGATIGDLAIETDPDVTAAAKRIDAVLSPGERQRIITAHSAFFTQSRQLHDQMRNEFRSEMPADAHPPSTDRPRSHTNAMQFDAGTLLLGVLSPRPRMMGMGHGPGGFMMHMEGAPQH